ncbi:MAG: histidinol-phosphate transaminase [Acidobacteria bacterium]|nr:histidinol-phosphate transaminase [Acidobacteriota bacterium]MDP7691053.1 histidinol-phosphate transaminase [Vicinamibacterales bacterium]HJN46955.1 histidinol-phosphate transaminase [Vicinamibacterales bacterium]
MSFFRPTIDTLRPYVPGQQPAPGTRVVKLNTNENPYPPSPRALDVLRQLHEDRLRRYPHPRADEFREAVAEVLEVEPTWVLPGNGSDDLLTMLMRAIAGPGRPVVYPTPTYVLYRTLAEIQDAPVVEVPFDDSFDLPVGELAAARGALTLVANPNSPSGTAASTEQLAALAAAVEGVVVIDEAYVAFAEDDALRLVRRHPNVVILRTLSKSHALAGLRLGFAVAQPAVIEGLAKVKDSYNVGAAAACVGAAAIRDVAYTVDVAARIRASRSRLGSALEAMGCHVWPSQANFLLVRPPGEDAEGVSRELEARGILVRYFDEAALADTLRITIGTDDEQTALLETLRPILDATSAATG